MDRHGIFQFMGINPDTCEMISADALFYNEYTSTTKQSLR